MTSMTVFLRGKLEAMRTLEAKSNHWAVKRKKIRAEQERWLLESFRSDGRFSRFESKLGKFIQGAKHITLEVRVYRCRQFRDYDNLVYSFNKSIVDGWVNKGWLKDDSFKYLTMRTIGQVKCPSGQEGVEITIEKK